MGACRSDGRVTWSLTLQSLNLARVRTTGVGAMEALKDKLIREKQRREGPR